MYSINVHLLCLFADNATTPVKRNDRYLNGEHNPHSVLFSFIIAPHVQHKCTFTVFICRECYNSCEAKWQISEW